jgi:cellulose 1,4-beta-cellobiosidase
MTAHSCRSSGYTVCEGDKCGGGYSTSRSDGICDFHGCDFNPYRLGATDFFGVGKTVDTSKAMTVVTQFLGEGKDLKEIRRFYVQGGKVIANAKPTVSSLTGNSLTQEWCDKEAEIFGEKEYPFKSHGGMKSIGEAMSEGMVLVMSVWDDYYANMLWLDSVFPPGANATDAGVARGRCETTSGVPQEVEAGAGRAKVTFSNSEFRSASRKEKASAKLTY